MVLWDPRIFSLSPSGETGAPTCPHAFLFQSLWKLIVRSWKSRSCHLEVYMAYARESFQTAVVSAWSFCQPFLEKKKKPSGVQRNVPVLHSQASSAL